MAFLLSSPPVKEAFFNYISNKNKVKVLYTKKILLERAGLWRLIFASFRIPNRKAFL